MDVLDLRQQALVLMALTRYLVQANYLDEIPFDVEYPYDDDINIDDIMRKYFNGYAGIPAISVDDSDLANLFKFGDKDLRARVAKCLTNVDPVIAARESQKHHGGYEIADMEIAIKLRPGRTHFLCMPFKSAQEIKEPSVPDSVSYQIARPISDLDNCIVVFVTAKPCSQALLNSIKRMQGRNNWPIGVLEYKQLAGLLKINGQL